MYVNVLIQQFLTCLPVIIMSEVRLLKIRTGRFSFEAHNAAADATAMPLDILPPNAPDKNINIRSLASDMQIH